MVVGLLNGRGSWYLINAGKGLDFYLVFFCTES